MFKILTKSLLGLSLALGLCSAHAGTSTIINKSPSSVTYNFYAQSAANGAMTVRNSNVSLAPGAQQSHPHTYAAEFFVKNNGPDNVKVVVVDTSSNPPVENDYGDLYNGNGVYSVFVGSGATVEVRPTGPSACAATTLRWGSGNFCAGTAAETPFGGTAALTNSSAGASGSAAASCSGGAWTVTSPVCNVSLAAPAGLSATDGVFASSIGVTWGAVSGASTYRLQQRKVGSTAWADLSTSSSTGFTWTSVSDEGIFEFQVRAENALGTSTWSSIDVGSIRPKLAPVFVSQAGIPAKVGVGQAFTYTQVWKNAGSEVWTGGSYGTGPNSPANTSIWGAGFLAFTGSVSTDATTTTSITAVAPTSPGVYALQRAFWKAGVAYGAASSSVNVEVIGAPTCSAAAPNVATTYNVGGTVTVTLQGASSVESATIRAWGDLNGDDDAKSYPMLLSGSTWSAVVPIGDHVAADEAKINFEARVANSLFPAVVCATTSVGFQQLPLPVVTLTPTMGSYDAGGRPGFVADRSNGTFATIKVDLGSFTNLKAKVEIVDRANAEHGVTLNAVAGGVETPLRLLSARLGAELPAWTALNSIVRVTYADPEAASQGKRAALTIQTQLAPSVMQVTATGTTTSPAAVNARVASNGLFDASLHGTFLGALRSIPDSASVKSFAETSSNGEWSAGDLDYTQLFKTQLVAVARAVPPTGVTLLQPLEFLSSPFILPVQSPAQVVATDGTREDDVKVNWGAIAVDASIRYRLFRDEAEITPAGGIAVLEFLDAPPVRGQVYNYRVKAMVGSTTSTGEAADTGFIPACRAPRLIGASLNADLTRINGMLERWPCLESALAKGRVDAAPTAYDLAIDGTGPYRSFSFLLPAELADGPHVLNVDMVATGVDLLATRTFEIPFTLNRSSIAIKNLTILYNGSTATPGLEATSIGRFGIKMDGGSGVGFAEEVK
ncbi:fibronectin type III domain-containing protein [Acidovorax sp. sic0104]|uniref:fibronectin type III domain-containing protein n=1 Tax=Acidovorax sp. sic0104 TaxID=2854784 RepID=UPI001C4564EC|nr:fibronectin type III domain-containing protein [Acidovorax sp. sic0104]MBV7542118.1 fibronectin type III domain-containing protein [Acidovorax sp. sic0104]